jgi:hypothetical protein
MGSRASNMDIGRWKLVIVEERLIRMKGPIAGNDTDRGKLVIEAVPTFDG